ncbi:MAG: type VI secretion system accessory protein TagJ [Planctomycetota bacterium]
MTDSATTLYRAGKLTTAIEAAKAAIRSNPGDVDTRHLLAQLMAFVGDFQASDRQLKVLATEAPEHLVTIGLRRKTLEAAEHRRDVFEQGRLPEFLCEPDPILKHALRSLTEWREGALSNVKKQPAANTNSNLVVNDAAAPGLHDLDDILAGVLEFMTIDGGYGWVSWNDLRSLKLIEIEDLWDLIWRQAELDGSFGQIGRVFLPCLYVGSEKSEDPQVALGRSTEWDDESPVRRPLGLRIYASQQNEWTAHELQEVRAI